MNVVSCTTETCPLVLNSKCIFYESSALPYTGIATNDSVQVALQKIDAAIANAGVGTITSVNGDVGPIVVLTAASVGAAAAGDNISIFTNNVGYLTPAAAGILYAPISGSTNYWKTSGTTILSGSVNINRANLAIDVLTFDGGLIQIAPSYTNISGPISDLQLTNNGIGIRFNYTGNTQGDIFQRGASESVVIASVATGNALISGGIGGLNSWGKIGLTTHVSGTLPVANGGTGLGAIGAANTILKVNSAATALEFGTFGTTTQVIYNSAGVLSGSANLTFDGSNLNAKSIIITGFDNSNTLSIFNDTLNAVFTIGESAGATRIVMNLGGDAPGDIYYRHSDGKITRLAVGTNTHVLTLAGGLPTWAAPSGGGGITNTALVNQVTISDGTNIFGDSGLVWDATNNALTTGNTRIFNIATSSIYIGQASGNFTTTGTNNLGVGYNSLSAVTTGSGNTAIGTTVMNTLTTGQGNVWIGQDNSTSFNGNRNIVIGTHTVVATVISTGSFNVLIGNEIRSSAPTADGGLSIQNAIFGSGNIATATTVSNGNLGFFATAWGTNAAKVISIGSGTAPSGGNPVDAFQMYSSDSVAGNAAPHFQTELGHVIKLYRDTGWTLPTGTPSKAGFATSTATLTQVAESLKAVMDHLMTNTGFFGA